MRSASLISGEQLNVRMPVAGVPASRPQQRISPDGAYSHQRIDPVEEVVRLFVIDVLNSAPELSFGGGLHVSLPSARWMARVVSGAETGVKEELTQYKSTTYAILPKPPASFCVQNMGLRSPALGS